MTTIAIVGAAPARWLIAAASLLEGFAVALLSRQQEHVDALAAHLAAAGVTARGYAAHVREPGENIVAALQRVRDELGPIEVLQQHQPSSPRPRSCTRRTPP